MTELRLQSKCKNVIDRTTIDVSGFAIPLTLDEKRLERDISNFLKRFAEKKQENLVEKNDILTLSCTSMVSKFQKKHITLRIGLGLFSKSLENQCLGLECPGEYELIVDDQPVHVSLETNFREYLPELTDDFAASCGMEEINTVEDIYDRCRALQYDRQLEDAAEEALTYATRQVIDQAEFELDEEECRLAVDRALDNLRVNSRLQGMDYDSLDEETYCEVFGMPRKMMEDSFQLIGKSSLKSALIGQYYLEQKGALLTEEDYEQYLEKLVLSTEEEKEEVRKKHSVFEFILDEYCDYYLTSMEKWVLKKLRECA